MQVFKNIVMDRFSWGKRMHARATAAVSKHLLAVET